MNISLVGAFLYCWLKPTIPLASSEALSSATHSATGIGAKQFMLRLGRNSRRRTTRPTKSATSGTTFQAQVSTAPGLAAWPPPSSKRGWQRYSRTRSRLNMGWTCSIASCVEAADLTRKLIDAHPNGTRSACAREKLASKFTLRLFSEVFIGFPA